MAVDGNWQKQMRGFGFAQWVPEANAEGLGKLDSLRG